MASRDDFDDFFSNDDTTTIVDTRADGRLYRVPLGRLSPNLVNPRTLFGSKAELIDLGRSLARRQNQPCPVVSRSAYLKLWPDHAEQIGDVDYVLVSGERRFRSAREVDLPALNCVADDGAAADRKTFMEAVVSENVDRANFDSIEEAYAVQALVREFGSNRAVAQHFERADGWVTQRILLTNLDPQMQDLVRTKAMPLEAARTLGKLARDKQWDTSAQVAWWEEQQRERQAASAARKEAKRDVQKAPEPPPPDPSFTAVKQAAVPKTASSPGGGAGVVPVVHQDPPATKGDMGKGELGTVRQLAPPAAPEQPPPVPVPGARPEQNGTLDKRPPLPDMVTVEAVEFGRPDSVRKLLRERMTPENFRALVEGLMEDLD